MSAARLGHNKKGRAKTGYQPIKSAARGVSG
jgi:hypothetical protein